MVGTSVWIDYLRASDKKGTQQFIHLSSGASIHANGITGVIYQEVLQGADSTEDFDRLLEYLIMQRFYIRRIQSPVIKKLQDCSFAAAVRA